MSGTEKPSKEKPKETDIPLNDVPSVVDINTPKQMEPLYYECDDDYSTFS